MRYEFEFFYIHGDRLLLGPSVELMEELLDLANREQQAASKERLNKKSLKGHQPRTSSPAL